MAPRAGRGRVLADELNQPDAIFVGFNALGDTLCTTPVIRAYRRRYPKARISYIVQGAPYTRVLDGNPDIDLVLYSEFLTRHGMKGFSADWIREQPIDLSRGATMFLFDMNQVCTSWDAFQEHIATGFSRLVQIPIDGVRPIVHVTPRERAAAASLVRAPYAVLSMHSNSNPPRVGGDGRVKDWPVDRFAAVCAHLRTRGIVDIVAVGFGVRREAPRPAMAQPARPAHQGGRSTAAGGQRGDHARERARAPLARRRRADGHDLLEHRAARLGQPGRGPPV